jgi:hypothetical protein
MMIVGDSYLCSLLTCIDHALPIAGFHTLATEAKSAGDTAGADAHKRQPWVDPQPAPANDRLRCRAEFFGGMDRAA